tara:strand:+ start:46 stop:306 length:261 start_codon:yes stop_codon:yes gene_type:complete
MFLQKITNFDSNPFHAKIQGLSIQAGEVFAQLYAEDPSSDAACDALEAYKSLRRLLPMQSTFGDVIGEDRHEGSRAAHKATQGYTK